MCAKFTYLVKVIFPYLAVTIGRHSEVCALNFLVSFFSADKRPSPFSIHTPQKTLF